MFRILVYVQSFLMLIALIIVILLLVRGMQDHAIAFGSSAIITVILLSMRMLTIAKRVSHGYHY